MKNAIVITLLEEEIKRWRERRKTARVSKIAQGRATVTEASWAYDLPPFESEY